MKDRFGVIKNQIVPVINWLHLRMKQKVLIVSSEKHVVEARILKEACMEHSLQVDLMLLEEKGKNRDIFCIKTY